jgi:ABC-type amino acid transport system permease subunit
LVSLAALIVNCTRGIPTGFLVIMLGVFVLKFMPPINLEWKFPGTYSGFQALAWGAVIGLALGSSGHFAVIILAALGTVEVAFYDQMKLLDLSTHMQTRLIWHRIALSVGPPMCARFIHHMHNTAFVSLFPVIELFGVTRSLAINTTHVIEYMALATGIYTALSIAIWICFRYYEYYFTRFLLKRGISM